MSGGNEYLCDDCAADISADEWDAPFLRAGLRGIADHGGGLWDGEACRSAAEAALRGAEESRVVPPAPPEGDKVEALTPAEAKCARDALHGAMMTVQGLKPEVRESYALIEQTYLKLDRLSPPQPTEEGQCEDS